MHGGNVARKVHGWLRGTNMKHAVAKHSRNKR